MSTPACFHGEIWKKKYIYIYLAILSRVKFYTCKNSALGHLKIIFYEIILLTCPNMEKEKQNNNIFKKKKKKSFQESSFYAQDILV